MRKHSVFTFSICGPGAEILTISFSNDSWNLTPRASKEEMVISRKSKDSMLSQTLKVEEKKVTIFFLYLTQESRYGHFVIVHVLPFVDTSFVDLTRNRNISHNDQILIFSKKISNFVQPSKKNINMFL